MHGNLLLSTLIASLSLTLNPGIVVAGTADDEWCSVQALGFTVFSDLPASELTALIANLERFEALAAPYLPGRDADERGPMRMLIFRSHRAFVRYFGSRKFVGFVQPSLTASTVVIAPQRGNRLLVETARHEYSHYLLRNRPNVNVPLWLDEGLASMLAAARFDNESVRVGAIPANVRELAGRNRKERLPLSTVLETDYLLAWRQADIEDFYAWAWLLTHYLYRSGERERAALDAFLNDRSQPLTAYLKRSALRLERVLERHASRYRAESEEPSAPVALGTSEPHCLSPLERDLVIGDAIVEHNPKGALKLLEAYEEEQGSDARLLVLASRAQDELEDHAAAMALARQAEALDPGNARVLVNLADRITYDCKLRVSEECWALWREAAPLYRQALKIDRQRYDAVLGLGLSYLHSGRSGEAVNYLRVAYGRAPWAVPVNFYLGEAYRLIGDTRARLHLENARNWAQNEVWLALTEAALAELEEAAL